MDNYPLDNDLFTDIQSECCPKFNREITRGLAHVQIKDVENYMHRRLEIASKAFPPEVKYTGNWERCTPAEEFNVLTAKRGNKKGSRQIFEMSHSTVFMVKYFFTFNGELLKPVYVYLPYSLPGGLLYITGNPYSASAVLADKTMSVGEDDIFIPLGLDRLTFRRESHHYVGNGKRYLSQLIWCDLYHKRNKGGRRGKRMIKSLSTIGHYLFAKYGMLETFMKYANADIAIGNPETLNETTHPADTWMICESTQIKPDDIYNKYHPKTDIRLAIRHEHYTELTAGLIATFFYIADRYPLRMVPEYVVDYRLWRSILALIIFASEESEGKLLLRLETHLESLDEYVDTILIQELESEGVYIENLYDFLAHIIQSFSHRVANAGENIASMYNKELMVLRYLMFDFVYAINRLRFALKASARKGLTKQDVEKKLRDHLRIYLIRHINHDHGEVSSVSSPSDCMSFKITTNVRLQTNITSTMSSNKVVSVTAADLLHVSIAEIGQYNNQPKAEPTGRQRLNPFQRLGPGWRTIPDPAKRYITEKTQLHLQGKPYYPLEGEEE